MIVEMKCTCGACPVQYEGKLTNGRYFYFRARWGEWSFAVADSHDAAVTQAMLIDPAEFQRHGETGEMFSASWMELVEAERIIHECVAEYAQTIEVNDAR